MSREKFFKYTIGRLLEIRVMLKYNINFYRHLKKRSPKDKKLQEAMEYSINQSKDNLKEINEAIKLLNL